MTDQQPRWIDGPPVPLRRAVVPAHQENGYTPTSQFFELRWAKPFVRHPERVVDHDVFAAAVFSLTMGEDTLSKAILESLGYKVTLLSPVLPA